MYADNGGKVICVHHIECYTFLLKEWLLYHFVTVM